MLVFKNFIFEIRLEIDGSQKPFVEKYHLNQSEASLRFGLRQNLEFKDIEGSLQIHPEQL